MNTTNNEFMSELFQLLSRRIEINEELEKSCGFTSNCKVWGKIHGCATCLDLCSGHSHWEFCLRKSRKIDGDIARLIESKSLLLIKEIEVPQTAFRGYLKKKAHKEQSTFGHIGELLKYFCNKFDIKINK